MTWLTSSISALLVLHVIPAAVVMGFRGGSLRCNVQMSSGSPRSPQEQVAREGAPESRLRFVSGLVGVAAAAALPLTALADPPLEKFTKDEVCLQRGLNGACSKFGVSDAAEEAVVNVSKAPVQEEPESELMATLKRRTIENKARNDEEIVTKTFVNSQSGEFGPFSRYVPVKHKDTGKYELVLVAELDSMKREGLVINERGVNVYVEPKR
ncbi:unnamed protein product [Pylaiella littoralis]